ncbi:DEAD/DEAH box helicase [Fulvivirga sp. M361]|uniref:DEAD/DEAH box helicase n=1 Tax=Fulvivirga sp. M361 TaxID=2594266 RepID=UPI00117B98B1|nr:DEAD/DEAH box helicase [Fulvivirga sp. M361]TRX50005.1 DEAD/DEAH box helicase [Fulvivirga sp. M361]
MTDFHTLGLSSSVLEVLEKLGFERPTDIQTKAIPILLQEDPTDFIGLAQTGTGKTAAFGLPLIDLIDTSDTAVQALVMSPTRELSQQTAKQLIDFTSNNKALNVEVVYGGANIVTQIKALKKTTQIVVATPGRLIDLIKRKAISLENVQYVVLDEADEMLNMGFKEDIDDILSYTPQDRVTWLFSATMPSEIRRIVKKYMQHPKEVSINAREKSNKDITHQYVMTKSSNKLAALRRFLDIQPDMRGIMFCRTKRETQQISDELTEKGYGAEALHGDLSQGQRDAVMKRFKSRSMQLLIATDVAARGIDVNDLTHVFHHTLPDQLESYTHRSGRTGRAGNKGISLVFINPRESRRISELEGKIKVKFERVEVPTKEALTSIRVQNWANLIQNTTVDAQADILASEVEKQFAGLSKEDLIKRLITTQLDHLSTQASEPADLNEKHGSSNTQSNGNMLRYFINVGMMDGLTKGDLIHFLSDVSGVERTLFGEVTMQKSYSFFEVDKSQASGMANNFDDIEIQGRSIRVNRDDSGGGSKRSQHQSHGRKKDKRQKPRQQFSRSRRGRR